MKREKIILISKDVMGKFYLPIYGNKYFNTPNIDELASKGTVFHRHYTSAPSTAMSFTSMFTGLYPYQTNRKDYRPIRHESFDSTLFDKAKELGYNCHIIWPSGYKAEHAKVYGEGTSFHKVIDFEQCVGPHFPHNGILYSDPLKSENAIDNALKIIENIVLAEQRCFIWIHFPHVINGSTCYGEDIESFDRAIGRVRKVFNDEEIFITADHGNMNGVKGKVVYGFDVYEPAINIPLITPRIQELERVDEISSNIDLFPIIFESVIPKHDYVISDSAYYAQPTRKCAIIGERYKLIYSAKDRKEELYDLLFDPNENVNLLQDPYVDTDRHILTPLREVYYYPAWDQANDAYEQLRRIKDSFWKWPSTTEKIEGASIVLAKNTYKKIRRIERIIKTKMKQ